MPQNTQLNWQEERVNKKQKKKKKLEIEEWLMKPNKPSSFLAATYFTTGSSWSRFESLLSHIFEKPHHRFMRGEYLLHHKLLK